VLDQGALSAAEVEGLEGQIRAQIDEAEAFARESPEPSVDQLMTDIYA
jgi:TPP-dependent pyruvate/acetoin dehydrogenase alpha subunit